jgi:hypothetical protein
MGSTAFTATDVLRVAGWICVNGMAAWLAGPLISRESPQVATVIFGLVLGVLQSAAISRTWREAMAWSAVTLVALPVAVLVAFVGVLFALYGSLLELRLAGGVLGLIVGAGVGIAQGWVFRMRKAPGRVIAIWTLGNAAAAAVVGVIALADPLASRGPEELARAVHGLVSGDLARAAYGVVFGTLTALPLAVALIDARDSALARGDE